MENIRIGTRLLIGFSGVVLLTMILGLYALYRQNAAQALTQEVQTRDFRTLQSVQLLEQREERMRAARQRVLLNAYLRRDHLSSPAPEAVEHEWMQARDENQSSLHQLEGSLGNWESDAISP